MADDDRKRTGSPDQDGNNVEKKSTEIDRQKVPPFLVRMFFRRNSFHRLETFLPPVSIATREELQMYTWFNGTLKEILAVFSSVVPEALNCQCTFRHVFQDPQNNLPSLMFKDVAVYTPRGSKGGDANWADIDGKSLDESTLTLGDFQFRIGDYIDVNITSPDAPPPAPTRSGHARGRDWPSNVENKLDRRTSGRGGRFGRSSGDRRWGP
ncbi:Sin3 associated polypeptide p18-domain-containing protein [Lipomyces kononenkoae]|uniref:Sin3 associated polypeptide p18-domain-containing protein n=1 Tax=Lipomyces kononenkoae TaxID=34357 RepID=A0ACC3T1M7_LIPKO